MFAKDYSVLKYRILLVNSHNVATIEGIAAGYSIHMGFQMADLNFKTTIHFLPFNKMLFSGLKGLSLLLCLDSNAINTCVSRILFRFQIQAAAGVFVTTVQDCAVTIIWEMTNM